MGCVGSGGALLAGEALTYRGGWMALRERRAGSSLHRMLKCSKTAEFVAGQSSRNPWLDVLRSIAILLVVVCHGLNFFAFTPAVIKAEPVLGYMGVELFFVLSGFLVGGALLERYLQDDNIKTWIVDFWAQRWLRTLPNYYLFLVIEIALEYAWNGNCPDFGSYFFLMQNFAWEQSRLFGQSWSLTIEELFYFSLPLIILISTRVRIASKMQRFLFACLCLFVASFTLRAHAALDASPFSTSIRQIAVFRLDSIMTGVFGYYAYRKWQFARNQIIGFLGLVICLLSVLVIMGELGDYERSGFWRIFWFPITSLGLSCILTGFIQRVSVPIWLQIPAQSIAKWAYSMYLVNSPLVISMLVWGPSAHAGNPMRNAALFIFYLATTTAISAYIYRHFELVLLNKYRLHGFIPFWRLKLPRVNGSKPAVLDAFEKNVN
jgi:peptidoglycan/LPS O-acetylase OafA/YrhL